MPDATHCSHKKSINTQFPPMFRAATRASQNNLQRIFCREKYLYQSSEKNISFYSFDCQSLIQQLAAIQRCHRVTIIFISMTLHLKFTAFIELYSACHTSHCAALFSLLRLLSPHHSSKLSITIIGAYYLFSLFSIMQQIL